MENSRRCKTCRYRELEYTEQPCMTCVFESAYGEKRPYWKKRTLLQKIGYDKMSALSRSLFAGTIYIVVFFGIMVGWLEIAERSIVLGAAVMIVFHAVTASAVTKWILTKME